MAPTFVCNVLLGVEVPSLTLKAWDTMIKVSPIVGQLVSVTLCLLVV